MPTVEVNDAEKKWLMDLRRETPGKDRVRESVASVMKRIHANYTDPKVEG
jgi:hypothetical protein